MDAKQIIDEIDPDKFKCDECGTYMRYERKGLIEENCPNCGKYHLTMGGLVIPLKFKNTKELKL